MATDRNKKKAKKVRYRTAVRKVVRRIRKLEAKAPKDIALGSAEYWANVAGRLSLTDLRIAVDYVTRYNTSESWYRIDLFAVMEEALKNALIEKQIGLSEVK